MDEVFTRTLDAIAQTLGFNYAGIGISKGSSFTIEKYRRIGFPRFLHNLPLDEPTTKAINTGNTILLQDISNRPEYMSSFPQIKSELVVPLKRKEEVIGILDVESEKRNAFTQDDKRLLQKLANHVAVVVGKLREKKQRKEAEEKLETLHKWARRLNRAEDMDEIYQDTLNAMDQTLGVGYASILLKHGEVLELQDSKRHRSPSPWSAQNLQQMPLDGPGITVKVANTGETILANDVSKHPAYVAGSPKTRSELAVPIKIDEEVLGVLDAQSVKLNAFDQEDRRLMEILASHVAVAIEELREEQKRVTLQRLDALRNQFLRMAAHEINTPLTPIKSGLEMLQQGYYGELTKKQEKETTRMLESVERLHRLVQDFRRITKLRSRRMELEQKEHQLRATVDTAIENYQKIAKEEEIQLHKDLPSSLSAIYDEDRIIQVIRNLVENAIDYTEDAVWINGGEQEDVIWFSVRDNGPGIPPEEQDKIFRPFYRVEEDRGRGERRFGGTGLGLTICKRIVEEHGGEIQVDAKLGKGSTFTVRLPKRGKGKK